MVKIDDAFLAKKIKRLKFPKPHQYKTVTAGSNDTIYTYTIPHGFVGFVEQISNSWYSNTYLIWTIGGERVEEANIEREMAAINSPKEYKPPIFVEQDYEIKWVAYNDDGSDHSFEVLCDGYIICKTDLRVK